jgi:F0F1-type ATP synthase assembly protein I
MRPESKKKNQEEDDSDRSWLIYTGLGMQLAVTVTAMTFLGIWLDKKFNTSPILTIVCSFLGITAGMYNFIKTVLKSH